MANVIFFRWMFQLIQISCQIYMLQLNQAVSQTAFKSFSSLRSSEIFRAQRE